MDKKNLATNHERAYSFGIDLLIITVIQLTLGSLTLLIYQKACAQYGVAIDEDTQLFLSQFCGGFFFLSYFTLSIGLFGNTVGKSVFKLKIIHENTGKKLTMPQAYWRSMSYLMSSWTYMVGFILPWFRSDKKALHDLLCGTLVVKAVQNGATNELQLELPLLANVHPIRTQTKQEVHGLARTGTDR